MQNQLYSEENQVNFGLLNERDQIYKKTTKTNESRSYDMIKLALIIFTASAIISTLGIISIYLSNSNDELNYNSLVENYNEEKHPVINEYQELKNEEDIPSEMEVNPELNPTEIDVHLIVEQMIIRKKISLSVPNGYSLVEKTTTTTTTAPKILDYLLATIVVNRATVPNRDGVFGLTDAFVKVFVDNRFIGQTPAHKNTLSPVWNYQIIQDIKIETNSELEFQVWDSDKYTSHELIGKCGLRISDLMSNGANGQVMVENYGSGRLWFTIKWEEVYKNQ